MNWRMAIMARKSKKEIDIDSFDGDLNSKLRVKVWDTIVGHKYMKFPAELKDILTEKFNFKNKKLLEYVRYGKIKYYQIELTDSKWYKIREFLKCEKIGIDKKNG